MEVRVDDPRGNTRVLQMRMHAFPVDAGAFHDHQLDAQFAEPSGQGTAVAPKAAKLAAGLLDRPIGLLDHDGDHMQHAVNIDTGYPPVQGFKSFHSLAPVSE